MNWDDIGMILVYGLILITPIIMIIGYMFIDSYDYQFKKRKL